MGQWIVDNLATLIVLVGTTGPLAFWLNWRYQQRKTVLDEQQRQWENKQREEQARLEREKADLERRRADMDADTMLVNNAETFRRMIGELQREMVERDGAARLQVEEVRREAQGAREASERSAQEAQLARRESHRAKQISLILSDQVGEIKDKIDNAADRLSAAIIIVVSVSRDQAEGSVQSLEDAEIKLREVVKLLDEVRSLPPVVIDGDPPLLTERKPQTHPLDPNTPIRGPGSAKGIPKRPKNIIAGDEQ